MAAQKSLARTRGRQYRQPRQPYLAIHAGRRRGDQDVECRATASDQPITLVSIENADAELPRNEQPSARGDGAAGGALKGALTVVGIILKLGPVGVVLCGVGGPYCVALVFVGASIGAASAR